LGLAILINGIFGLQSAMNILRNSTKNWLVVLTPSIVTILLGLLILANPFHWAKNLLIILGAFLVWNGVSNFWTHLCLCKKEKEAEKIKSSIETTADEEVK
jgi:uncharacterized membrane protein HdeD (DUF308 family)